GLERAHRMRAWNAGFARRSERSPPEGRSPEACAPRSSPIGGQPAAPPERAAPGGPGGRGTARDPDADRGPLAAPQGRVEAAPSGILTFPSRTGDPLPIF